MLLALLSLAAACNESEETDPVDGDAVESDTDGDAEAAPDDPPDPQACKAGLITTGFGFRWEKVNHRVSLLGFNPQWEACSLDSTAAGNLDVSFIGGDWSTGDMMTDFPSVSYSYSMVASDQLGFHHDSVELDLYAPENEAETDVYLTLSEIDLSGFDAYIVLINGIHLTTDVEQGEGYPEDYNPANGYTSQGFGAWVSTPSMEEDLLSFTTHLRFDHGPSDRDKMNEAMKFAHTHGRLDYLVIGIEDGALHQTSVSYRLSYEQSAPFEDEVFEHAAEADRLAPLDLESDLSEAFFGWQQFNFSLDPEGNADPDYGGEVGYYIREMSLSGKLASFDPDQGEAVMDLDGYVSNASGFFVNHPLVHDFHGTTVLVQVPELTVLSGSIDEPFDTGQAQFELPAPE